MPFDFCCCPFFNRRRFVRVLPPPSPPIVPTGLQVQLSGGTTIINGANVLFNNIITNLSPNILYNPATGIFTVMRTGIYIIDWWINTDGAQEATHILFNIVTSTGVTIGASSPDAVVTLQLNGQALINMQAGTTFSLVNNTGATVTLSTSPIQADLRIVRVDTI